MSCLNLSPQGLSHASRIVLPMRMSSSSDSLFCSVIAMLPGPLHWALEWCDSPVARRPLGSSPRRVGRDGNAVSPLLGS